MKIRQTRSPESYVYCTLSPFTVWVIKKRQRTAAVVVRETVDDVEARRWEKNCRIFPSLLPKISLVKFSLLVTLIGA